ncbi:MAG: transporter [Nitrospinae bacterium]|nr:transporter [Nitrospinota bacterium]
MRRMRLGGLIGLVTLWAGGLLCATSSQAGRPLATQDAGTVGVGRFELELGGAYTRERNDDRAVDTGFVLAFGSSSRSQVEVEVPFAFLRPAEGMNAEGFGDVELRGKYRFFDEAPLWPAPGLMLTLKSPTGSERRGLGTGTTDVALTALATKTLGPLVAHLNLSYTFNGTSEEDNVFGYAFALELPVTGRFKLVSELVGETHADPAAQADPLVVLFGATFELKNGVILDSALNLGLTNASPDYQVLVGVTVSF